MKKKKLTYISEDSEKAGSQIKKVKGRLKQCQKEKEEYLSQAQRARADLINYRKRQEQIIEQLKNYGQAGLIEQILSVLDSLKAGSAKDEGIKKIKEQLENILNKYELKEIEAVGYKFDPEFHEVIEGEGEMIVEEIQKGYILGDKVLRASKVKIAKQN